MSFFIYDMIFMAVFIIAVALFLYRKRHNLKRQGWIYLYHSKRGIQFMKSFAKRYKKILEPLQYVVITCGYLLLAAMIWLLGVTVYRYITIPEIVNVIKAPPVAPLIPYFPSLFGLESFFPPLYFTYFIVALAVVAIVHEFAHGVFAKLNGIRIKTTGFAFLGPILGAFVEPDEKQMEKSKKFPQLSVLAGGTFANVLFAIIFGAVLALFFALSFTPAGVNFNTYPSSVISLDSVDSVNGFPIENIEEVLEIVEANGSLVSLGAGEEKYFATDFALRNAIESGDVEEALVFENAPAVRAGLRGPILSIDGKETTSREELSSILNSHSPGDSIMIKTKQDDKTKFYNITLAERDGNAYLGVGMNYPGGLQGIYFDFVANSKNTGKIYYETTWDGDIVWFIYYLLWWIVLINILVALFNMLPLGILDGGRFFYLTVWGITGSEKIGKKVFIATTWLIIMVFVAMMLAWFLALV